jgi:site-specific DNA-methyltransferase (adenine-specific)
MSDTTPNGSRIIQGDNLQVLTSLPDQSCQMVYLDPPFNTGRTQTKTRRTMTRSETGSQVGFGGNRYDVTIEALQSYDDQFTDYWAFLGPRLEQCHRILHDTGTLYLHLDWREAHYAKVALDGLFGRECFLNEIIWAYDYGAKSKKRWPTKHDTILVYVKNPDTYYFDSESVDREPYMAPGLVTEEKRERGKLPTDVWWHTIVSPTGKEKTGYPTQKPLGLLKRMIQASTKPGDLVVDAFGGSGTTGEAAGKLERKFLLIDQNPEAISVMTSRLEKFSPIVTT